MVEPLNCDAIKAYIFYSVTMSILAVASSKITSLDFLKIALQIQINYLSPELKFCPFSAIC
jgi:hypothetical protein